MHRILRILLVFALASSFLYSPLGKNFPRKTANVAFAKSKQTKKSKKKKNDKAGKESEEDFPVRIIGDLLCQARTKEALGNLKKNGPSYYKQVVSNLGAVECSLKGSGTFVWENPARFRVGLASYQSGKLWYSSVLVHESCHIGQYRNYFQDFPNQLVPSSAFSGAIAENECLRVQYDALLGLGADEPLLDYVKNIAQTNYWEIPAEKRWW